MLASACVPGISPSLKRRTVRIMARNSTIAGGEQVNGYRRIECTGQKYFIAKIVLADLGVSSKRQIAQIVFYGSDAVECISFYRLRHKGREVIFLQVLRRWITEQVRTAFDIAGHIR